MPLSARLPICISTGSQFANDARIPSHPPAATLDEIVLTNLHQRGLAPETMHLMNHGSPNDRFAPRAVVP